MEKRFGWLNERQKNIAFILYQDAGVHDGYWYKLTVNGVVFDRSAESETKCNYPDCHCPFDKPIDPDWCAMGYSSKQHNTELTGPQQRVEDYDK